MVINIRGDMVTSILPFFVWWTLSKYGEKIRNPYELIDVISEIKMDGLTIEGYD